MKKTIGFILILFMLFTMNATVFADSDEMTSLLDLSDTECIAFLEDYNVSIPDLYEDEADCVPFVRAVIEMVETNAETIVLYECYALEKFADEIEMAIHEFYGDADISAYITSPSANILEDNIVEGDWLSKYESYNSYGYAIEREEWLMPGISWWLGQNEPAETYEYNGYASLTTLANWIQADLEYYGFTVISATTTLPNVQVGGHTKIICFRKDLDEVLMLNKHGLLELNHDIHFMRMGTDGSWYHKPSSTNPLKYMYTPSNSRAWVREGYNGKNQEYFRYEELAYESTIYYIQYTTPHEWSYAYYGPGQHIVTCTICGLEQLGECELGSPTYLGLDSHQSSCNLCGGAQPAETCNYEYIYYGVVNNRNTHIYACTTCGHIDSGPTACVYFKTNPCGWCGSTNHIITGIDLEEETLVSE